MNQSIEMGVPIKAMVPGFTTIVLENGDTLVVQTTAGKVKLLLGGKDPNGNPLYNCDIRNDIAVIPGGARTRDGTNPTADADGRHGEQPG
jgi:hypothetical protein